MISLGLLHVRTMGCACGKPHEIVVSAITRLFYGSLARTLALAAAPDPTDGRVAVFCFVQPGAVTPTSLMRGVRRSVRGGQFDFVCPPTRTTHPCGAHVQASQRNQGVPTSSSHTCYCVLRALRSRMPKSGQSGSGGGGVCL